jgi:PLP dependent protein
MSTIIERFEEIKFKITALKPPKNTNIIAVSKTFSLNHIKPLIDYGHRHFGENKVQEATSKWSEVDRAGKNINLHMIGKLQSNKAKDAVKIFDYIHSLDSQKLADILCKTEKNLNKKLKYFIQVNMANELQKSGMPINELDPFYNYCTKELNLKILGLMVIPPRGNETKKYFKNLYELNTSLSLKDLSMGMSADYEDAVRCGSTFLRIGSNIFGSRS